MKPLNPFAHRPSHPGAPSRPRDMGNSRSRPQRRPEDDAPPPPGAPTQQPRPGAPPNYAQYPPPASTPGSRCVDASSSPPHSQPPPPSLTHSEPYLPHTDALPPRRPFQRAVLRRLERWRPPSPTSRPPTHPHRPPYPPQNVVPPPPPAPTTQLTQTATIRNAVNLKKPTLKLTPVPGSPDTLAITFSFDASAPCVVSTFVVVTEEPSAGCRLVPALQTAGPAVIYPKGLGHAFPAASTPADVAAKHVVDTSLYYADRSLLHTCSGDRYPLAIRLEVITDKGLKAGHTLEELVPGDRTEAVGAEPDDVCSGTAGGGWHLVRVRH